MEVLPNAHRSWSNRRNWLVCLLLALATVHCIQSIFLVNVSLFDLKAYAHGQVKMPFQGRVAMMPVLRGAGESHAVQKAATFVQTKVFKGKNIPLEIYSPEKLTSMVVGLLFTLCAVAFAVFVGRRIVPNIWWLPSVLFIYMLYVTFAARSEQQFWYPYDLPHFALFGIAAVCILYGYWVPAFFLFLLDMPMRETSIYLVPVLLAMGYVRGRLRQAIPWAAVMVLVWLPIHILIGRHFAANPTDTRIHWEYFRHMTKNPWPWAQIASAFGFLLIPFCFAFDYLNREERFFVYGAIPGLAFTAIFGIWYESRIWDEWLLPAAVLMSLQAVRCFGIRGLKPVQDEALDSQSPGQSWPEQRSRPEIAPRPDQVVAS